MKHLAPAIPPTPKGLSKEAAAWWREFNEMYELEGPALLLLENALTAFDRMREAQAVLRKEGITIIDRFKQVRQHPCTLIERDAKATMLRQIQALGLDLEPVQDGPGRPAGVGNRR